MRVTPAVGQIREYFQLAAEQAVQATCLRAHCGTVIVKDGMVIGAGFNAPPAGDESQRKCEVEFDQTLKASYDKTCCVHAEWNAILSALRDAGPRVIGSTLYFMRVDELGNFTGAGKPFCTVCSRLSLEAGVAEFVLWHDGNAQFYDTREYNLASSAPYEG
jgi:deoxycytidylate deaminase